MPTSLCTKAIPAVHSVPPVVQLSGQTITCVYFLSPRSSLTSPLPRQERSVVSPSWKTGVQFLSLPRSLWCVGPAWCNSASSRNQVVPCFRSSATFCGVTPAHLTVTPAPLLATHTTTAPFDANPDGGPTSVFVLWWRVIQSVALFAALGLSDYSRFSHKGLLFHRLVRSSRRAFWRRWQHNIQQIHNMNPEHVRVRSDVVSGFHHGLRPPPWLGRQAWTIPPNCLVCDRWRLHFSSVASSQDTHYSLDFFNLISSHFVDLTSASSSGPFNAPFSAPELAQALAQCHDSAPDHDGLPYSAFKPDLPWWLGMLLQFFNLVLQWNTVPAAWKISTVVPVFKHGDPASPDQHRPIFLASCTFKIFERLICTRIAPHISERLNEGQGGFR